MFSAGSISFYLEYGVQVLLLLLSITLRSWQLTALEVSFLVFTNGSPTNRREKYKVAVWRNSDRRNTAWIAGLIFGQPYYDLACLNGLGYPHYTALGVHLFN